MIEQKRVAVLGFGTMGKTIASGLLQSGALTPEALRATVAHADKTEALAHEAGVDVGTDNVSAVQGADVVLLCVKPKRMRALVAELAASGAFSHEPLVISIAAGISTGAIEAASPAPLRVVRAMPNTPCRIGAGTTVLARGRHAHADDMVVAREVMQPLGRVLELDEEHMDAVTGLSASGPAFIYVIIEALAEGGVMVGLPRTVATELAAQCVQGAARMVLETGRHPAALKDDVTTPAGCTVSALLALEDGKLRSVLARGVQEAARTAAALGQPPGRPQDEV